MADPGDFESEFDDQFNAGKTVFGYTGEFLFDSDEGSPLPSMPDTYAPGPSRTMADALQDCPSPSEALNLVSRSSRSTESSQEYLFDSVSPKGTASTASTLPTTLGDPRMTFGAGAGVKQEWGLLDSMGGQTRATDMTALHDTFGFLNDNALTQPTLRTPADTPSPFGSGAPTFSPADTMASPVAEAGPSFRAAFEDGFTAFTFDPSESGMRSSAVSAGSFAPGSLVLRQSQPQMSPVPKFDFRGSQEPDVSATFNPMQPMGGHQFAAGAPFYPESLHAALQGPVEHQQYGPGPYKLDVFANNTKSRVETQIMITLRVSQLPVGVTKVHLPRHTISKPKFWTKPASGPSPDTLELHTMLVCTSAMRVPEYQAAALQRAAQAAHAAWLDRKQINQRPGSLNVNGSPAGKKREADDRDGGVRSEADSEPIKTQEGGEVRICENCIGRETKRASRKKSKNPEDEAAWQKDETKRVIVFNTHEVKDWAIQNPPDPGSRSYWQMQAPMRIACYCRHHSEKLGFQIIFTLTNHHGRSIAQTLSPSIMITDDHKTISPNPAVANAAGASAGMLSPREDMSGPSLEPSPSLELQAATRRSSAGSIVSGAAAPTAQGHSSLQQSHAKAISRPASPSFPAGPSKRRRGNKSITKAPNDLMMTPLDTSFVSGAGIISSAASQTTPATSLPPTPQPMFTSTGEMPFFGAGTAGPEALPNGFGGSPQTNGNGNPLLMPNLNRTANLGGLSTPAFSLSASARPNPASSPSAPRAAPSASGTPARVQQPQTRPAIFKVIPGEGPIAGSVEVTVMGQGFAPGMQVMFGDKQAPGAACWSSESLVCLLPPSPIACMVPVTLRNQNGQALCLAPSLFRYVDDSEQQLLRTALMILGNKMTGTYEDVADFARRIIKEAGSSYPSPGGDMSGGDGPSGGAMENFEGHLLKLLELMDLSNSTRKPRLNLRRSTGQTMLHLACKLGLHRFVAGLLARGANPDPRDKGGYTALHMASMHNHTEIVRLLISHGADPTLRNLSGLTAVDVATSRDVAHVIQHFKQHRRTQSGSALHSRVNSSVSLKSLRAQVSMTQALEDTSSDEPRTEEEESSSAYASDELVESGASEQIGESPAVIAPARRRSPSRQRRRGTDATGALGLPSAAMAAIREQVATQFQQFQQMMGPHLQYLPQLPQFPQFPQFAQFRQLPQFSQLPTFPQMPNMPPLPEYQNPLQRLATMIGGAKPEQGGEATTPPPAYEELFPQQQQQQQQQQQGDGNDSGRDMDIKKASAARAAADATADAKCAALFDQQQTTVDVKTTTATATAAATGEVETIKTTVAAASTAEDRAEDDSEGQEIPALLQIGRKDAITSEQQATLRRAHAQKMRRRSWDRNLFFVWIPLLILIVAAMVYHGMPGFVAATRKATASLVPEARREAAPLPLAAAPVLDGGAGVL